VNGEQYYTKPSQQPRCVEARIFRRRVVFPGKRNVHLRQIKLAGFKSFVDPTQIEVPGSLVGVVGPNGCGKSNVIDAVRWVLGESKAAELRGESMQDVIFNGSVNRKPGGRASVELVFDNSDGPGACSRATAHPATTSTTTACGGATCRTCSSAPVWDPVPTRSSARA